MSWAGYEGKKGSSIPFQQKQEKSRRHEEANRKLRSREDQENTRKSERNATTRIVKTNEFNTPDLRINLTTEDTESQSSSSNRPMKDGLIN